MPSGPFSLINPAPWAYRITSMLGDPRPYGEHEGIDLAPTAKSGPYPVVAAGPGKVVDVGFQPDGWGNYLKIDHGNGLQTLYAHLSDAPYVNRGDTVQQAQVIGNAGSTGYSTGTHLHFSVIKEGQYVNPIDWITDAAYEIIEHVDEQVSEILDRLRSDCYADWFAGKLTDAEFEECVHENMPPEDLDALKRDETIGQYLSGSDAASGVARAIRDIDAGTIKAAPGYFGDKISEGATAGLSSALSRELKPIQDWITNGVTWPVRVFVNGFKLSENPLTSGSETLDWLRQPENQTVALAAGATFVIVIILIIVIATQLFKAPTEIIVDSAVSALAGAE